MSVDIDLNYIGSTDRETMYAERSIFENAIIDIGNELEFKVEPGAEEHSGRHFKFMYRSIFGSDYIKIDADYLNRSPLLNPEIIQLQLDDNSIVAFPLNSPIELIGGKLKALLSRVVPRDLYDICNIARIYPSLLADGDEQLLRRILLYNSVLSDAFPKPFDVRGRFGGKEAEVEEMLYPMLPASQRPDLQSMIDIAAMFVNGTTVPVDEVEEEFLNQAAKAQFEPTLLFKGYRDVLQAAVKDPAAAWKMLNLKKTIG
jgi:hypothetical protein